MTEKKRLSVLVIDDEPEVIHSYRQAFKAHWDVTGVTHPDELKKDMADKFRRFGNTDLIFLDLLFNVRVRVTKENVLEQIEKGELLGIQFLDWIAENYSYPVVISSGFLFDEVVKKLHDTYPWVLLKAKPINLYEASFRSNMEHYATTFFKHKYDKLLDDLSNPLRECIKELEDGIKKLR